MVIKLAFRILARRPSEFIQPLTTCSGVEYPAAIFSPAVLYRIPASSRAVKQVVPSGRVWSKSVESSLTCTWAAALMVPLVCRAESPSFARSSLTSRITSLTKSSLNGDYFQPGPFLFSVLPAGVLQKMLVLKSS